MEINPTSSIAARAIDNDASIDTRRLLKQVARRLIAENGVRNVTVRQIAEAARQKNRGVVAYYFRTKENLLAEILIEGAARIESRREVYLAELEATGGPSTLRAAVDAIVRPSAAFSDEDVEYGKYLNRFMMQLSLSNPVLVDQILQNGGNKAYQRCLEHLRRLLSDFSRPQQNRRFLFLGNYVSTLLAQRETMLLDAVQSHPTWASPTTLDDIVCTAAALLAAPTSD